MTVVENAQASLALPQIQALAAADMAAVDALIRRRLASDVVRWRQATAAHAGGAGQPRLWWCAH